MLHGGITVEIHKKAKQPPKPMSYTYTIIGKHTIATWEPTIVDGKFYCPLCARMMPVSQFARASKLYCRDCEPTVVAQKRQQPGPADDDGEEMPPAPSIVREKPSKPQPEGVAKLRVARTPLPRPKTHRRGIMQHRGRPRKQGQVCRQTLWRRQHAVVR